MIEEHGTAGQITSFDYDEEGNLIEIEDPVGRITEQSYDELNRLATITDPAEQLTKLGYDDLDNLLSVTDPRALETSYAYNGFGEQISQSSPDTGASSSPRDAAGNLATATDARSETGEYTHDALNRVTEIEYGDDTVTFGYDAGTNGNGRLTSVANGASTTSFSYDAVGRVTERSQAVGSVTLDVGYDYDSYGRLESLTTPSGQLLSYEYQDGRVSGLKVNGSYLLSGVSYQPFGPTTGWLWGNSAETSREYDTDGELTVLSSAGTSTYTYNDDGTIESQDDDFAPDLSWADGTTTFAVASSSNRLQSATGLVSRSYSYDATGNTTSDGTHTFTYNDAGRMKTSAVASVTTTYSYNGLGERVKKSKSGSTTYFAYDEAGHLIGEYDASGNLIEETVWFGDIPVAVLKPNGTGISVFYIHTDHLNTPRRITRPSDNAIVWRWDSDPFGDTNADEDPDDDTIDFAYQLRFPGQYFDAETGLHYNYFRDYDAVSGRYTESDPIGLAGGLNTYAYVSGNPGGFVDPLGLQLGSLACFRDPLCVELLYPQLSKAAIKRVTSAAVTGAGLGVLTNMCLEGTDNEGTSTEGSDDDGRPPSNSKPIDKTHWSGDHQGIKQGVGAGPDDIVVIAPGSNDVWVRNPDGTWTNHGPAGSYTGSDKPSGRRGKDRERR